MTTAERKSKAWAETFQLLVVIILGAGLRLLNIGHRPLWFDEAVIYQVAQGSWLDIVAKNAAMSSAPPLYPLLLGLLTGPDASEAVLRGLSMVAGTATIPLVWLLARQFMPAPAAVLAALLVAVSPVQVAYSQELREYSLACSLATALACVMAWYARSPDYRRAVLVGITAFVALNTQYGLALVIAGLGLACLANWFNSRQPLSVVFMLSLPLALSAGAVAYMYWSTARMQLAVVASMVGEDYLGGRYWDGTIGGLSTLFAAPDANIIEWAYPGVPALILVCVGTFSFLRRAAGWLPISLLVFPLGVVVSAAMLGLYPFGAVRQNIIFLPMIYVAAAQGALTAYGLLRQRLADPIPKVLITVAVLVVVASGLSETRQNVHQTPTQDLRTVAESLRDAVRPNDAIYVYWGAAPAFAYYWRSEAQPFVAGAPPWSLESPVGVPGEHTQDVAREIEVMLQESDTVWLVISHFKQDHLEQLISLVTRFGSINRVIEADSAAAIRIVK